jgi:Tol biopolymer transport system component
VYPLAGDSARVAVPGVSRDGATMALVYNDSLRTLDLATLGPVATIPGPVGSLAVSPDGRLVIVSNMGMLQLRDARTGKGVGSPDGRVMLGAMATQPDWSPDGTAIAVAVGTMVTNMDIKAGSIARVPYLGNGAWGPPRMLVASTGDMDNNVSPRWSPDGAYLAYVHSDGPAGDPSAELRIVAADGGSPIALTRASHRVAVTDLPGLASSMPAWAPATPGATQMMWLAFVSARAYGAARPMPGAGQIWIAAIDPARLAGGDPSAAAFWLPAQDITAVGASPAWAPAVPVTAVARSVAAGSPRAADN